MATAATCTLPAPRQSVSTRVPNRSRPLPQGLLKPVNDLSRGCTVPDIVNTICVTSIQATRGKAHGVRGAEARQLVAA